MYNFEYVRPSSLDEAAKALASNGEATLLAGGQTLLPTLRQRLAQPSALVDLSGISELSGISLKGNTLEIGATTSHAAVAASKDVNKAIPALAHLASTIGDNQVRHRGTIGGSIANNDPAADYPAAVLGLGATVVTNKRKIAADDFFEGLFTTALDEGEIVTSVRFPVPKKAGYAKFEQRASRFALVGVFAAQTANGVRVAVTGAGENGVFRSSELESALEGSFSADAVSGVSIPANGLMGDLHGSAQYRAALIKAVAEDAVAAA